MYRDVNVVQSGGVEIRGLKASLAPRRQQSQAAPKLERYVFVPLNGDKAASGEGEKVRTAVLTGLLQLVLENSGGALKMKVVEVEGDRGQDALLAPHVISILEAEPTLAVDVALASTSTDALPQPLADLGVKQVSLEKAGPFEAPAGSHLVVTTDLSARAEPALWKKISESLKPGGFVLAEELGSAEFTVPKDSGLVVVGKQWADKNTYTLLRKVDPVPKPEVINVSNTDFSWVEPLKKALKESEANGQRILLVSQGEENSGLIGLVTCLMREPGGLNLRSVLVQDPKAPAFSLSTPIYAKQLELDLVSNVLRNATSNQWGTYRHILLDNPRDVASLQVEHAYINTLSRGDLASLRWIEGPLTFYK